jgi:hypothetical protein
MRSTLAGLAALALVGTVALPLQASAAERQPAGITKAHVDEMSAQRRYHRRYYARRYWAPRRYYGPRYGYYGYPHAYGYGYPYGYYRPGPAISFGLGPFGFGVF